MGVDLAVRFTHAGSITLRTQPERERLRIEVRDEGIGISPSFLPHVFDEFRQESTGHARAYEGTGLGLAMAHRLTEAMGGHLEAESTPGVGSVFALSLETAPDGRHTDARRKSIPRPR